MTFNSSIWRSSSPGQSETSVSGDERIFFNNSDITELDQLISGTEMEMTRALGRQSRIRKNRSHHIEDTGFEGLTPVITGAIKTKGTNGLTISRIIKKWMLEPQFNDSLPEGRFGLRLNDNSAFNLTPQAVRGYILEKFKLIRPGALSGKIEFIATLRFNGDIGTGPNYDW